MSEAAGIVRCAGPCRQLFLRLPGTRRRFCSVACRKAAYRRRAAGLPENAPLVHHQGKLPLARLLEVNR